MSVYDLYQSYLNQQQASPVMTSPVMDPNYLLYLQQLQQRGGGDGPYQEPQFNQQHAGIYSISDLMQNLQNIPTPLNLARMGIEGIGNLINNIQDPYKTFTGALKPDVTQAIQRDTVRDMAMQNERSGEGGFGAGYGGDFMGGSGRSEDMGSF